MSTGERLMPRHAAISSASAGCVVPENTIIRFRVRMSRITGPCVPALAITTSPPFLPLALVVSLDDALLGSLHRQRAGGNVPGDHRAGSRPRPLPDLDRRHQHRIRADVHLVPDHGAVLPEAVVVDGDGRRADVRVPPDGCVANVREVGNLGPPADP